LKLGERRTDTNINLTDSDRIGDLVYGSKTGGALAVHRVDGRSVGNASVEGSHTSGSGTSGSWENVANGYVLDELGVEVDGRVDGFEGGGK
jgi:hypothetical protein